MNDDCGVKHPTEPSWVPCMRPTGHEGEHWSTSGCAGGQVRWTQPEPAHVLVEPVAGGVIVSADLVERLRAAHEAWLETVGPKIDGRTKFAAMDAGLAEAVRQYRRRRRWAWIRRLLGRPVPPRPRL